jgi:hypothetical protein
MQRCIFRKTAQVWRGCLPISRILLIGSLVFCALFTRVEAAPLTAFPCTLAWDPCHDSTVSGYRLYYGIINSTTTNRLEVGMTNLVTINNLLASSNYFFYVVAYDRNDIESTPSIVMCYTPQALSAMKLTRMANRTINLHFLAAAGAVCHVEYNSLNPPKWQTLSGATADANGNVTITDPLSGTPAVRLYRVVMP